MRVNPYRKTLKIMGNPLGPVMAGVKATFRLFAGMSIQNNLAENINAVLQSILRLRGPKTIESVENRLRASVIVRNSPEVICEMEIKRAVHGIFLLNNIKDVDKFDMAERGWKFAGLEKMK